MHQDRLKHLIDRQAFLALDPVICVVPGAGSMEPKESCQSIRAKFTLQQIESVPLKLLVC